MPEPTAPAVVAPASAEPAPAPVSQPAAAQHAADIDIEKMSPASKEYQDWRMGKLPKTSAVKQGDSVTPVDPNAPPAEHADPATAKTTDAAGSEPALTRKPNLKTPEDSEKRFNELLEERGRLKQQKEYLEEQIRQLTETDQPASDPAEADELQAPRLDDLDEQGKPKFQTIADWQDAVRAFDRKQILKEFETRQTKTQEEQRKAHVEQVINDGWKKRVGDAAKKYADYDAVALNPDLKIPAGSLLEAFLLDSEHGAHVLYELGKNPAELTRIAEIKNPQRAFRELLKIESKFSPAAAPAPKRTITAAPPPPHEIGGSGAVLPDEIEQAAKEAEDDPQAVRRFINADTRRDLAKRKR